MLDNRIRNLWYCITLSRFGFLLRWIHVTMGFIPASSLFAFNCFIFCNIIYYGCCGMSVLVFTCLCVIRCILWLCAWCECTFREKEVTSGKELLFYVEWAEDSLVFVSNTKAARVKQLRQMLRKKRTHNSSIKGLPDHYEFDLETFFTMSLNEFRLEWNMIYINVYTITFEMDQSRFNGNYYGLFKSLDFFFSLWNPTMIVIILQI